MASHCSSEMTIQTVQFSPRLFPMLVIVLYCYLLEHPCAMVKFKKKKKPKSTALFRSKLKLQKLLAGVREKIEIDWDVAYGQQILFLGVSGFTLTLDFAGKSSLGEGGVVEKNEQAPFWPLLSPAPDFAIWTIIASSRRLQWHQPNQGDLGRGGAAFNIYIYIILRKTRQLEFTV